MTIDIAHASASRVRAVLDGHHGLTPIQVSAVIDSLLAAGLCTADVTSAGRLRAAQISHSNRLESEARSTAARLNIAISAAGEIDPDDLARALKNHNVESRLRIKSMFAQCSMIA